MRNSHAITSYWQWLSLTAATPLLSCLLLLTPALLLADDRPVIEVKFSIEGDEFDGLNQQSREAIQIKVEDQISTLAERRWGFLDWSRSSSSVPEAAQWNVTLKVDKIPITTDSGDTTAGFIGTLQHSGKLGARVLDFDQIPENETIYPIGSFIPFQNATDLENDISRQLDKQLEPLFQSPQVEAYMKQIPIIDRVIADAAHSRVLVPVKMHDLRTGGDSVLAVVFLHDNNRGQLNLETAGEVPEDGLHKGYVIGRVQDLRLFPITIDTPTWWDDKLFPVITSAVEVKVFMLSYSPSLSGGWETENGLISEPDL